MIEDKVYITSNGLTMVKSKNLCWQRLHKYADGTGPFFYSIYVGGFADGHICNYIDEDKILSISFMRYSSDDPPLKFKVDNIDEASKIVSMFAKGMNVDLSETIYAGKIK